jgi:hypothetical protein
MKSGTVPALLKVSLQLGLATAHPGVGAAGKAVHQRAYEKLEADKAADGIARQSEDV